jgi:hypothetical protein
MTLGAALVTVKLHRAEVGLASLVAIGVSVLALVLVGPSPIDLFEEVLWDALTILPFGFGLICGVPIVSRELESRTAQIAWSLNGSRTRWLVRQSLPVLLALSASVGIAAAAASALLAEPDAHPEAPFVLIGSYGLSFLARAIGAFGIGVFLGALVGRAIPALILGGLLCVAISTAMTGLRGTWFASQTPQVPIDNLSGYIQNGWAMREPDGSQIALDVARARAPEGQDADSWLEANGYQWLPLGIPIEQATAWVWYDTAAFLTIAGVALAGGAVLVNRRRPA